MRLGIRADGEDRILFRIRDDDRLLLRIRHERLLKQWSLRDLAKKSKITLAELSRFENLLQIPYPTQLARLSRVLNVREEDLFKEVQGKPLPIRLYRRVQRGKKRPWIKVSK